MDLSARYPARPGFSEPGTSKDAAKPPRGGPERPRGRVFGAGRHDGPEWQEADQAAFCEGLP